MQDKDSTDAQELTPAAVDALVKECLFATGEPHDGAIIVRGIVSSFGFHPGRIEERRARISGLLNQLPESFKRTGGGGMSFLNACLDRQGNLWTGDHATMESLFVLGEAAGLVKTCLPREMWPALPGGMPYYVILDDEGGAS